jgi:hypothetical protein
MVFGVLRYVKTHSSSIKEFIETWHDVTDYIMVLSLPYTEDIESNISFVLRAHLCVFSLVWPIHIFMNIWVFVFLGIYKLFKILLDKLASKLLNTSKKTSTKHPICN